MAVRANVDLKVNMASVKRSMDRAAREINKTVQNVSGKDISFNVNGKSFTQPLGRITSSANEFTKSLEASNARVIAFGASVGIINAITDSFKFLIAETIRFEKTLQDINVVLNSSNEQIQKFGQGLFDVAQNTAQSFNIAADAALEFSRQGLSVEEVLKRTNDALTLTRITSLDAAEAVSGLTAAVNAFGEAGLTTTDIIDKLAAVDVKFAVSSEDLINGLERAGAVAIDAGVSLDSLVGIITSLQQTTARGGAVIGNGLKTIFTRIQRPESLRQLEDMGIAVRGLTGAILPADQVLKSIAKTFDSLTQAQQSNIVQFSAGIFQANIFRAALTDLAKTQGIQQQATEISSNAAGEAARKNELLNKSISAMASQAGSGLKELVGIMGELSIKPDLGEAVGLFGNAIEGIKNALGGGEDEGNSFAKGLVRGIGKVLTGPGVIAFAAIFTKLLYNVFKFASGSLKDVLGIVTQKEKVRQIEESIVKVLGSNVQVTQALNRLEGDRVAQEQYILGIIEAQTNALAKQQQLASKLGSNLLSRGITPDLSYNNKPGTLVDIDGDGLFRYSGLLPQEKNTERKGAIEGGYSPGRVTKMKVPGMGEVIYNTAEKVKSFEGMKQPAIMPPQSSRAGRNYKEKFSEKHGFDPYASGGLIPNFVTDHKSGSQSYDIDDYKKLIDELYDEVKSTGGLTARRAEEISKATMPIITVSRNGKMTSVQGVSDKSINYHITNLKKSEGKSSSIYPELLGYPGAKDVEDALKASQEGAGHAGTVIPSRKPIVWSPADIIWAMKDSIILNSSLKNVQEASRSLKDSSFKPGAAYIGTDIGQTEASAKIRSFQKDPKTGSAVPLLDPLGSNNYSSHAERYIPHMLDHTTGKYSEKGLDKNNLAAMGITTGGQFENFITQTKNSIQNPEGAPLDFSNPKAEAKFTSISTQGNYKYIDILSKIIRDNVGNNTSNFTSAENYKKAFQSKELRGIDLYQTAFEGLIPNFADDRVRSEKIQAVLNDPANANIKFKAPANITPAQISRVLKVPMGGKTPKKYSDSQIKNAISETIQTRKNLELPGFENLDNVDVNSVLKKYKESIKDGKYYGNKDLSYSSGLVPNFVDKVQNGAIYYSKPHNKIVRVTRVDNDKKIARIKHHDMEKYKDEEVFFKDLEAVSAEQAKEYFQKKSSGLVPNFASVTLKNDVTENQEKMNLKGTPFQNFPKHIEDQIRRPDGSLGGGNIKFKTPSSNLKTSTFKNIGSYLEALGVDHIETTIPFDFIDLPVNKKGRMTNDTRKGLTEGTPKQRGNFAESKFLESDAGKEYLSTSLDDQAVVDAISSDGAPTEVKSASITLQNIFEKSIRRYSNKKFRDTLESVASYHKEPSRYENPNTKIGGFSTSGEIADALSQSIAQLEEDSIVKNLSTLARMGEYTIPGMTKEELESSIRGNNFRQDLLASGIGQDEKDVLNRFGLNKGFVPNYKKLYQAYIGDDKNFRSNRTGDGWYFDSQKGTDEALDGWRTVLATAAVNQDLDNLYAREYSISDSNLKEMTSGIYSSGNLRKLRVMSKAFQANNSLPDQNDEEWEDDLLNNSGDGFDEAYDEMEGRLGAYSRLRKTQRQDRLWKNHMAGTENNPLPLATYKNDGMYGSGYIIPDLGPGDVFRDGFTIEDDKKIRSIFSPNLNRDNYLIERKISEKYLNNKEYADMISSVAKNPEKAMNAARRIGVQGIKEHVATQGSKGFIPNYNILTESASAMFKASGISQTYNRLMHEATNIASMTGATDSVVLGSGKGPFQLGQFNIEEMPRNGMSWKQYEDAALMKTGMNNSKGSLKWSGSSAVDGFMPVRGDTQNDEEITVEFMEAKSSNWKPTLISDKFVRGVWENSGGGSKLWGGKGSPFNNTKAQKIKVEGTLVTPNKVASALSAGVFDKGLIPNFAFKNSPVRLDGGFGRKGRIIQDEDTGSFMTYVKDGANVRDINFLQSNERGDAYKMIRSELEGKFMKRGGKYTSGSIKQQKSFKQGSSSNFEDLLYAFPQLRYRMQERALTSGRLINEALGSSHKFSRIKDLEGYVNKINRKDFQNTLGTKEIGNRILITDLSTSLDESKNRSKGLVPNFAQLFKAYDNQGKHVGSENDYFLADNIEQAGLMMKANRHIKNQISRFQKIRKFNISDSMWGLLRSKDPMQVSEREDLSLPKLSPGERKFMAQTASTYNIKPPFFKATRGGAFSTSLTASPAHLAMFKLDRDSGEEFQFTNSKKSDSLIPNFSKVTKTIKAQENRVKGKGEFIGRGLSEGDKDIAFNMFDYFISKISGLSSSFGFNDARASLTGTPDDRNLIETFKTSGKSEKDLIQIAGSQRKLRNILDGYMLGHFETLLLAKGKFKEAKDPLMQGDLSKGLVPNFVKLNRKNLSDKDKMSDSKLLRKKWRDKMGEIAPYVKQIEKGGARIEIDPIISKLNEEANRIWGELQKLRDGQDYYIPNLADPLQEAIHREKSAGVPSSRIKIEKSSQLKSPMNPMGLAVTNTRDEPGGLAQGIRRAKKQRIDPKRHGIDVPNFNNMDYGPDKPPPKIEKNAPIFEELSKSIKSNNTEVKAAAKNQKENNKAVNQQTKSKNKETEASKKNIKATGDNLTKLFFFQSTLSMANGFLQELGETGNKTTRSLASFGESVSNIAGSFIQQKTLINEVLQQTGQQGRGIDIGSILGSKKGKGKTKLEGNLASQNKGLFSSLLGSVGSLAKGFARFLPLIGQAFVAFTLVNEVVKKFSGSLAKLPFLGFLGKLEEGEGIMDLFKSSADRAKSSLEKLAQKGELLGSTLEKITKIEEKQTKVAELKALGNKRTNKQDQELFKAEIDVLDAQNTLEKKLNEAVLNVKDKELSSKIEEIINKGINNTEVKKLLENAQKQTKQEELARTISVGFLDRADKKDFDFEKAINKNELNFLGSKSIKPLDQDQLKAVSEGNILSLEKIMPQLIKELKKTKSNLNTFAKAAAEAAKKQIKLVEELTEIQEAAIDSKKLLDREYFLMDQRYKNELLRNNIAQKIVDSEQKILDANQKILMEKGVFSQNQGIANEFSIKRQKIDFDLNKKIDDARLKALQDIQKATQETITFDFGPDAREGKPISDILNFNIDGQARKNIEDDLGIEFNNNDVQKVQGLLDELSRELEGVKDNPSATVKIAKKYNEIQESNVATLFTLGLTEANLYGTTAKSLETAKKALAEEKSTLVNARALAAIQIESLSEEEKRAEISKKTVKGAEILAATYLKQGSIAQIQEKVSSSEVENRKGIVLNLALQNKIEEKKLEHLRASGVLLEQSIAEQIKKNQKEAESSELSLNQTLAQIAILTTLDKEDQRRKDAETILENKFKSEVASAELAAIEAEKREEFFRIQGNLSDFAEFQVRSEQANARVSAQLNLEKLKILSSSKNISAEVETQLKEEITGAQKTALLTASKALLLSHNKKQAELLQKANTLQELSNKYSEAENAIRKANISNAEVSTNTGLQLITEKAQAFSDTRSAGERALQTGDPKDMLAYAQKLEETNKLFGTGTEVVDKLRVKMAEMAESASNLKAELVETGIENLRGNMVQMFKDIGSGAKSVGEAYSDLGLGLAEAVLDKIMQRNVDNIISNLTYAFTGVDDKSDAKMISDSNELLSSNLDTAAKNMKEYANQLEALRGDLTNSIQNRSNDTQEGASFLKEGMENIKFGFDALLKKLQKLINKAKRNPKVGLQTEEAKQTLGQNFKQQTEEVINNFINSFDEKSTMLGEHLYSSLKSAIDRALEATEIKSTTFDEIEKQKDNIPQSTQDLNQANNRLVEIDKKLDAIKLKREGLIEKAKEYTPEEKDEVEKFFAGPEAFGRYVPGSGVFTQEQKEEDQERQKRIKDGTSDPEQQLVDKLIGPLSNSTSGLGAQYEFGEKSFEKAEKKKDVLSKNIKDNKGHIEEAKKYVLERKKELESQNISGSEKHKIEKEIVAKLDEIKNLTEKNKEFSEEINLITNNVRNIQDGVLAANKKLLELATKRVELEQKILGLKVKEGKGLELVSKGSPTTIDPPVSNDPPIKNKFWGGKIQRFAKGGLVEGPGGTDNVPAMLTAGEYVLPKDQVQKFNKGGKAKFSDRLQSGLQGVAQATVMTMTASAINKAMGKGEKKEAPPTFDMNRLEPTKLASTVSMAVTDPRMSGRALAKSRRIQDYKDFLLEKAAFETRKKNEKVSEKMGFLKSALGTLSSYAMSGITEIVKKPLAKAISFAKRKAGNVFKGHLGFGKHSDAFKHARRRGYKVNYKDVAKSFDSGESLIVMNSKTKQYNELKPVTAQDGGIFDTSVMQRKVDFDNLESVNKYQNNLESTYKRKQPEKFNLGGKIPAMLTAGEGFVPSKMAQKIGYQNLESMNRNGSIPTVQGNAGIDKVGPVGLDEGDFIIRKSSTDKLMRDNPNTMRFAMQNPDGFRRAATGYYEGGIVGTANQSNPSFTQSNTNKPTTQPTNRIQPLIESTQAQQTEKISPAQNNEITNNINVNVTIDGSGKESVETQTPEGSYEQEQELAMKIKTKVLEVIRQEKRLGGELDK